METSIITFQANEQELTKTGGVDKFASSTVAYVEAHFELGTNWDSFDSVRAMWRFGSEVLATVLAIENGVGVCQVPHELLEKRGELKVNLVGSIVEDEVISDRLTTFPIVALIITKVAMVTSDETEVTPSQFEQFVAIVKDDADRAEDARDDAESAESSASQSAEDADIARINAESAQNSAEIAQGKAEDAQEEAERLVAQIQDLSAQGVQLLPSETAYANYDPQTGILTIGIPQGVQGIQGEQGEKGDKGDTGATGATGATGNGIASVAKTGTSGLVDTYTITFTDGTTTTFNVTNGEDGSVAPSAIASDYSSSSTYAVGDYVWYDGDLYRCTTAITTAEAWTSGHWTEVALADEVSEVKNALSVSLPHAKIIEFQNKNFSISTGEITADNPARLISELLDIREGDTFSMDSDYQYEVFRFDRQGHYSSNPIAWTSGDTQFTATSAYGNYLHRIYVRKNDGVSAITADEIGITFDIASIGDTYFNVEDKVDNKYGGLLALKKEWKTAEQKTGTVTTGKFFRINGAETSSDAWNYRTLNVNPGEQYAVSAYAGIDARLWLILSASDTVLLYSVDNSSVSLKTETITIPTGGTKLIVNTEVQTDAEINAILIEKIGTLNVVEEKSVPDNLLSGKVLCCVGDSITYGADMDSEGFTNVPNITMYQCNNSGVFSEVTSRFRKTWGYQIAERNNMIFYNGGVSGSTMQGENGVNGFSLANGRYTKLPDALDYLVIWFGWNDTAYGTLGTITDDTNATFYGGYNVVIPYLQNKYPYAKILLVVPYGTNESHRNAVRQLGNKWGLAVWDNYQGGTPLYYGKEPSVGVKESVVTANQAKFQANGAHPNFKGHTQLADMIEAFLKTI